jgi:hypothetical protein
MLPPNEPLPIGNDLRSHIWSGFADEELKSLLFHMFAPIVDEFGVSNHKALPRV